MFLERLKGMNENKTDMDTRMSSLNKLINRAISNINKPNKIKSNKEEIISKINSKYSQNAN